MQRWEQHAAEAPKCKQFPVVHPDSQYFISHGITLTTQKDVLFITHINCFTPHE